jgi:hypothetical protein
MIDWDTGCVVILGGPPQSSTVMVAVALLVAPQAFTIRTQ